MAIAVFASVLMVGTVAFGQDLQGELDESQAELSEKRDRADVLTSDIAEYSDQIAQLEGEIALLEEREAEVQARLDEVKAELQAARARLEELRKRLDLSINLLEDRLVAIYKDDEPDALTVILEADGFDDLVERYEYLQRIHDQDEAIVTRVRDLRVEQVDLVGQIEAAKAEIAAKRRELERTRMQVEARQGDLEAVQAERQGVLDQVEENIQRLEGDISDIQGQIEAELQGSTSSSGSLPSGSPDSSVSSSGLIWPVDGVLTSPFGWRWGRMHEGIDIGLPAGSPIVAAASGTVALAAPYGGYGNYTCIDHGGGLSTCYAHQSVIGVSVGQSVSQGESIGLVGCTGSCFGDHLHFEVRINGSAVDPLGYL